MATNTAYYKQLLTGGSGAALDGINGTSLSNLDIAYVMVSNILYVYQLDSTSGGAESSPDVIAPDTNPGDKRWLLQNSYTADSSIALAKLADMATASFMGRTTAASGVPEILSKAQALAILNVTEGANVNVPVATDTIWTAAGELVIGTGANTAHKLAAGATTKILVGGGAADPVWTTASGSGAPVRATSPTLVTPALGTPASGDLSNCTNAGASILETQVFL